jgi:hypothetical protein
MQAIAERRARPNAKRFDRPYRDGPVFLHHFPALRTGLLSLYGQPRPGSCRTESGFALPEFRRLSTAQARLLRIRYVDNREVRIRSSSADHQKPDEIR